MSSSQWADLRLLTVPHGGLERCHSQHQRSSLGPVPATPPALTVQRINTELCHSGHYQAVTGRRADSPHPPPPHQIIMWPTTPPPSQPTPPSPPPPTQSESSVRSTRQYCYCFIIARENWQIAEVEILCFNFILIFSKCVEMFCSDVVIYFRTSALLTADCNSYYYLARSVLSCLDLVIIILLYQSMWPSS